jgi:quercetin dioxygenase-like cupin family protein
MSTKPFFPDFVKNLPAADIPIPGLSTYLLQAENQQVILMEFDQEVSVPEHSHEAQWGIVLKGRMDIVIGGSARTVQQGDSYFIPKDVKHSAKIYAGYKDLTIFNQRDRYHPKK